MFNWFKDHIAGIQTPLGTNTIAAPKPDFHTPSEISSPCAHYKKMGDLLLEQGKFAEAVEYYQLAITINPNHAEACNNLANAYLELNLFDKAEHYLQLAITIKPDLANSYYNLASLYLTQNKPIKAIEYLAKTLECAPKHYAALAILVYQSQKICDWEQLDQRIATLRRAVTQPAVSNENILSPFIFLTLPGTTATEQKYCAEKWFKSETSGVDKFNQQFQFKLERPSNQKIKIGYLSADFHDHATARLMVEIFELHNRDQFHITAYSYGPDDNSEMQNRLRMAFDQFIDIRNKSDSDAACDIYTDKIDILVDLKGFTQNSRSPIIAQRPAPIQVNFLGYPGTMGTGFVDYIIADRFIIPPTQQQCYAERVVYLPDCYQPNDSFRQRPSTPTRSDCSLPESVIVFCCFNQTYKITPEIFKIWCKLLISVPDSILWLFASNPNAEENLKRNAKINGVNPGRLIMAPALVPEMHLARLQCADLFLDTSPCNAHTTCSDALWMGLPVITCAGDTFPSRVAGSLLTAAAIPELITYNLADYYQLALELASDRKKLEAIRNKIVANRDTSPLFDSIRFTRNLEKAFVQMMDD